MSELKPCPFCGNDSPTLIQRHGKDGLHDWFYVLCDYVDCGCGATGQWNHEESDAIEAWNRRADK